LDAIQIPPADQMPDHALFLFQPNRIFSIQAVFNERQSRLKGKTEFSIVWDQDLTAEAVRVWVISTETSLPTP
jgi:hypothetical protein